MRQESKVLFIDVIRAIAAVMVVVIHVSGYAVDHFLEPQHEQPFFWWVAAFLNASSRVAVPLFVMVSGYLLLNHHDKNEPWSWLKNRLFRILIPLIVWIAIYFLWRQFSLPEGYSAMEMLRAIARGDPYYHLWFLYMLIGLYFATPILKTYLHGADRPNVKYFIVIWFLFTAIPPFINRALYINHFGLSVSVVSGFVGYYMLGYWMRDVVLTRTQSVLIGLAVILSMVVTTLGTYLLTSRAGGKVDELFFDAMTPNIIMGTLGIFAILKSVSWEAIYVRFSFIRSVIEVLSAASFFLYLSHPLLLGLLRITNIEYFSPATNPIIGIPITVTVITLMAVMIRSTLSRIPVINVKAFLG